MGCKPSLADTPVGPRPQQYRWPGNPQVLKPLPTAWGDPDVRYSRRREDQAEPSGFSWAVDLQKEGECG